MKAILLRNIEEKFTETFKICHNNENFKILFFFTNYQITTVHGSTSYILTIETPLEIYKVIIASRQKSVLRSQKNFASTKAEIS